MGIDPARDGGGGLVYRGAAAAHGACGRRAGRDAHKASTGVQGGKTQARGREPRDPPLHNSTRTGRRTNNVIFIFLRFSTIFD